LNDRGRDPGKEVEQKEWEVPEAVFDAAPEGKKKEHVPQEVKPPAMQEHEYKNGKHRAACREREQIRW